MKIAWQTASLVFLVLSGLMILASQSYPYGDKLGPGPSFFPVWISIVTAAFSLGLLFQIIKGRSGLDVSAKLMPDSQGIRRALISFLGLLGCVVLLEPLGFCLTVFLFLFLVPFGLGEHRWWRLLVFSLAGSFGLFYVFYYWLQLPLPLGILSI